MAATQQQPTDAEIIKFAADVAYNMGATMAIYKFANALNPNHPDYARALVDRLGPDQVEMITDLGKAGMQLNS